MSLGRSLRMREKRVVTRAGGNSAPCPESVDESWSGEDVVLAVSIMSSAMALSENPRVLSSSSHIFDTSDTYWSFATVSILPKPKRDVFPQGLRGRGERGREGEGRWERGEREEGGEGELRDLGLGIWIWIGIGVWMDLIVCV